MTKDTKKDKRKLPIDKAVKILADYKKNNYNAYKTLIENGYSEIYAKANARYTINSAKDKVDSALELDYSKSVKDTASTLYDVVGLSREEILKEYQSIIQQNINLAVKLRALEPLIRQEGIKWDEKEAQQAPSVAITIENTEKENKYIDAKDINEDYTLIDPK